MKHFIYVSVAVITALIIGGITITAADHTEQSNISLKQSMYEKTQEKQERRINKNTQEIRFLDKGVETISVKLDAILDKLESVECSNR